MDSTVIAELIGGGATILGSVLAAWIGLSVGKRRAFKSTKAREAYAHAVIIKYADELKRLIRKAVKQGPGSVLPNAQAIVLVRDDLRKRLKALEQLLNGQIDVLRFEVEKLDSNPQDEKQIERTWRAIQVLQDVWSSKETQITTALAELAAEIGFKEKWWETKATED